jgi:hypothetical protein
MPKTYLLRDGVQGLEFRVQGSGFGVWLIADSSLRGFYGFNFTIQGSEFEVLGSGFRVWLIADG